MFNQFKSAVQTQFNTMTATKLFKTGVSKNTLWELYLSSFPEGTNPLFRERTEHDCQCCKSFIRQFGNVVTIIDNELVSIWDITISDDAGYQTVAAALSAYVKSEPISNIYLSSEKQVGTDFNHEDSEPVKRWDHFCVTLPPAFVMRGDDIGTTLSSKRSTKEVFKRGLDELTIDSVETILELIEQNSLYRGEEHLPILAKFKKLWLKYQSTDNSDNFCWANYNQPGSRIRNSVIGSLLIDLSKGVDLNDAVKMFESKVAPANYKRPTALITPTMIANAEKVAVEKGIVDSFPRRHSTIDDITINNILFADRTAKAEMGIFDNLVSNAPIDKKKLSKVEEVSIYSFINDILPRAETLELLVENKHTNNLMSLISPVNPEAKSILKWDNNFSWSYNGEVADSMREQVAAKGGRVDGDFRFSHSWNELEPNQSLMDLHVFMPGNKHIADKKCHDHYGNADRVGWNHRKEPKSGGSQDVDYVNQAPKDYVPVENITFPNKGKMPDGKYLCKIHNWHFRNNGGKGKTEIEFGNQIFQYEYPTTKHKQWITVAEVTLKDGQFSIVHKLPETTSSKEVWSIATERFQKVSVVMNSPNHWDGNETGNKHYFFILEDCLNDSTARGFYNEFLSNDLTEHRKVFEVLGSKMKVEDSDSQLSGLGFSSTVRNSVLCKVTGSFTRTIKINF